jgi:hypothetical protein
MYSVQCARAYIVLVIQSTYSNWANLVVKWKNLEEIRLSEYIFVWHSTVYILDISSDVKLWRGKVTTSRISMVVVG